MTGIRDQKFKQAAGILRDAYLADVKAIVAEVETECIKAIREGWYTNVWMEEVVLGFVHEDAWGTVYAMAAGVLIASDNQCVTYVPEEIISEAEEMVIRYAQQAMKQDILDEIASEEELTRRAKEE